MALLEKHPENRCQKRFVCKLYDNAMKDDASDPPHHQPLSPALPWDDRKPRISWRGDGEYFVCSTIGSHTGSMSCACICVTGALCNALVITYHANKLNTALI